MFVYMHIDIHMDVGPDMYMITNIFGCIHF